MKKLIIHIGRHKSGTSSLQYFLQCNTNLLKHLGYYYPKKGLKNKIAHHHIVELIKRNNKKETEEFIRTFNEEVEPYENVIISSEAFQNIKDPTLLKKMFTNFDILIVCYFREILEYKISAYKQKVQATDYHDTFENFSKSMQVDYFKFYDRWNNIFNQMIIGIYDRSLLKCNNIIFDFFYKIGIKLNGTVNTSINRNYSIGGSLLYYKLYANKLGMHSLENYKNYSKIAAIDKKYRSNIIVAQKLKNKIRNKNNDFLKLKFEQWNLIETNHFEELSLDSIYDDFKFFNSFFPNNPINLDSKSYIEIKELL